MPDFLTLRVNGIHAQVDQKNELVNVETEDSERAKAVFNYLVTEGFCSEFFEMKY